MRYEQIYCGGEWVKAWPVMEKNLGRRWKCDRCGELLQFIVSHEPLHPIPAPESRRPPEEVAFEDSKTKGGSSVQELTEAVGQTPLQEHVMAMKTVLENAATELPEFQWLAFASITAAALRVQRLPK